MGDTAPSARDAYPTCSRRRSPRSARRARIWVPRTIRSRRRALEHEPHLLRANIPFLIEACTRSCVRGRVAQQRSDELGTLHLRLVRAGEHSRSPFTTIQAGRRLPRTTKVTATGARTYVVNPSGRPKCARSPTTRKALALNLPTAQSTPRGGHDVLSRASCGGPTPAGPARPGALAPGTLGSLRSPRVEELGPGSEAVRRSTSRDSRDNIRSVRSTRARSWPATRARRTSDGPCRARWPVGRNAARRRVRGVRREQPGRERLTPSGCGAPCSLRGRAALSLARRRVGQVNASMGRSAAARAAAVVPRGNGGSPPGARVRAACCAPALRLRPVNVPWRSAGVCACPAGATPSRLSVVDTRGKTSGARPLNSTTFTVRRRGALARGGWCLARRPAPPVPGMACAPSRAARQHLGSTRPRRRPRSPVTRPTTHSRMRPSSSSAPRLRGVEARSSWSTGPFADPFHDVLGLAGLSGSPRGRRSLAFESSDRSRSPRRERTAHHRLIADARRPPPGRATPLHPAAHGHRQAQARPLALT